MNHDFYNYDIYPKVVLEDTVVKITVKCRGTIYRVGTAFKKGKIYTVKLYELTNGSRKHYPNRQNERILNVVSVEDNRICFEASFPSEQEHYVRIYDGEEMLVQLSVYSLHHDMKGRYPYRGDLHVHTSRSDGVEDLKTVCANYRGCGYDFMAITDHHRYYPSLEAINFYKNVKLDFCLIPGEEVHMPYTDVHIVNFGGTYSVNALVAGNKNDQERGSDPLYRSFDGNCPACLTMEEYTEQLEKLIQELAIPDGIEKLSYAACVWAFQHIRKAGGLGIFAHPYWLYDVFQVPDNFLEYMLEMQPFDAFEVLGGESYYQQNGFQTARYYEDRAKGRNYPIVGSTDSHNSTENNQNRLICSTIVFAEKNERESLISAIKSCYSLAVDTIDPHYRLVGENRLVKYSCFLMDNYFPLHDRLCAAEGVMMSLAADDEERGRKLLEVAYGQVPAMIKKYFAN